MKFFPQLVPSNYGLLAVIVIIASGLITISYVSFKVTTPFEEMLDKSGWRKLPFSHRVVLYLIVFVIMGATWLLVKDKVGLFLVVAPIVLGATVVILIGYTKRYLKRREKVL